MIVDNKKDKKKELVPAKESKSNDFILVKSAILNILLIAKYRKNNTRIPNFYCTVKEIMRELPTSSMKYVYRVLTALEIQEYIENLTPQKREKHIKITTKGEDAVITFIKYLYPDNKQQKIALKMFYNSRYIPK